MRRELDYVRLNFGFTSFRFICDHYIEYYPVNESRILSVRSWRNFIWE